MSGKNIPKSKSQPLDVSIERMQAALDSLGVDIAFDKESNPLENCFWVNLNYVKAPELIYSNGKGASKKAAKASALGEFIERLQTNNFFSELYLPSNLIYPDQKLFDLDEVVLDEVLNGIYNPDSQLDSSDLIDFNTSYYEKIVALPFKRLATNTKHYIPLNILHNLYVSNGLATGNSTTEATIQALSEIYERYVKIEVIKNAYSLPLIPKEVIESFSKLQDDIKSLESQGFYVNVYDASLGGEFPVTAISLINPENSTLFLSFGSHPILEASLERTMTELMQGRDLDNLNNFCKPTLKQEEVAEQSNLESHFIDSNAKVSISLLSAKKSFDYAPWKYNKRTQKDELEFLLSIAKRLNKEVYIREYNYLGFDSVQVIVPTLSEIYPIDDLVYNNANSAKELRAHILNYHNLSELDELLNMLDELNESIDVASYIGVVFKKAFTIKTLKADIHLKLGNYEELSNLLEESSDRVEYALFELSNMYRQNLNWEDYENALYKIFTKEILDLAIAIFNGDEELIDITFDRKYLDILELYERLSHKKELNSFSP